MITVICARLEKVGSRWRILDFLLVGNWGESSPPKGIPTTGNLGLPTEATTSLARRDVGSHLSAEATLSPRLWLEDGVASNSELRTLLRPSRFAL